MHEAPKWMLLRSSNFGRNILKIYTLARFLTFAFQISIIVAVVFEFSLVCVYMIYQIFQGPNTTNSLLVTYAYTMRTFYFYSQILFAMIYGTKLSSEVIFKKLFFLKHVSYFRLFYRQNTRVTLSVKLWICHWISLF